MERKREGGDNGSGEKGVESNESPGAGGGVNTDVDKIETREGEAETAAFTYC